MALQLIITYKDDFEEDEFLINKNCSFLEIVDIEINEFNQSTICPKKDVHMTILKSTEEKEKIKEVISIDQNHFMAYIFPKEKIIFNNKVIEALIFSFLFEAEININPNLKQLPV